MGLGSRLTGFSLPLLPLALAACRLAPPDADEYLETEGTGGTSLGDDLPAPVSSTSGAADGETSEGHSGSGSGSSSGSESSSGEDTEPLPECGNGIVEGEEACDDEEQSATCDDDCTLVECGDGAINEVAGEQCDEAGESATCNVDCSSASCGDGIFNATAGEECDEAGRTGTCDGDCTFVGCGDGEVNASAGEACDDAGESASCDADCTIAECGDPTINPTAGEDCNGTELGGSTCVSEGFAGGPLGCDAACHFDTTACFACGDGASNPGESCDGDDLGGQTCLGLGFDGGMLACTGSCGYDTSGCYACGDGTANLGEECDGGDLNGSTCAAQGFLGGVLACSPGCTYDPTGCFSCVDGLHNGDETDIDCGNACGATCEPGEGCLVGSDCTSHGCDAGPSVCNDFLSVETTPACSNYAGAPAIVTATAAGGSGTYTYAWTPDDGTLTAPDQAATGASPVGQQTYTVTVDDGFAAAQDSVVVVNTAPLDLQNDCNVYGANNYSYQLDGTQTCATVNTSPGLHLCEGVALQNVRLRATLQVTNALGDDDSMGLVWGAQDESHFYSLSWRNGGICGPAGIVVKRVEGPSFVAVGVNDVHCPNDTATSTHLLGPLETTNLPWVQGVAYDVTIDFTELGSTVTVVRESDGMVIAAFFVADTTFTSGYFGGTTYSQQNACIGPLTAECL
jgi:hypothetical protein